MKFSVFSSGPGPHALPPTTRSTLPATGGNGSSGWEAGAELRTRKTPAAKPGSSFLRASVAAFCTIRS